MYSTIAKFSAFSHTLIQIKSLLNDAVKAENLAMVEYIVENYDIKKISDPIWKYNLMFLAAQTGNYQLLEYLMENLKGTF